MENQALVDYLYEAFTYKQAYTIYELLYDWGWFNTPGEEKYGYEPNNTSIYAWLEDAIYSSDVIEFDRSNNIEEQVICVLSELIKEALGEADKE